jgi:hypothetical protein
MLLLNESIQLRADDLLLWVGNEVDLFYENGIRNASYGYAEYEVEFDLYQQVRVHICGCHCRRSSELPCSD